MFALVDCNSFYASCEQVFRPDLRGKPVVVASNNDGAIIAMSKEAKTLGIPAMVPVFQIQDFLRQNNVHLFSSNYELYGDISNRVMRTIEAMTERMEVYSIDEAFVWCTGISDLKDYGHQCKQAIWMQQRIHVCVGIGPTKTLSKLANYCAKKIGKTSGVCVLDTSEKWNWVLQRVTTDKIWGIGSRLKRQLAENGIVTGADLAGFSPEKAKNAYGVVLARIIRELNGQACFELEYAPHPKKQIISSRSFGKNITDEKDLKEAVAFHAWNVSEDLRKQKSVANAIQVWVSTSKHANMKYSNAAAATIPGGTNNGQILSSYARCLLRQIYRKGFRYKKAGVMLFGISQHGQRDLFENHDNSELMSVMDQINGRYGRNTISLASQGRNNNWAMSRSYLSPAYTTRWADLPIVKS